MADDSDPHDVREDEETPSDALSDDEAGAVDEKKASSPRVLHEAVRLQGQEELGRPALSLLFSAFAAGAAMAASVLAQALLGERLPRTPAFELVAAFGYCVGYVIAIIGNLQLFTETTVTAVLPLATHPTWRNVARLARLWAIVLAGNLAGTLLAAALMARGGVLSPDQLGAAAALSAKLLEHDAARTLLLGIPSGFLVGAIAWLMPNARGSEFWVIVSITYLVAIGGFSHVVAGSTEAWLLWLTGRAPLGWALAGYVGPALVGNVIGGTGLFAVLAHGQVRSEI